MENQDITSELWEVEANGEVLSTHFEILTSWIADGAVLRMDRVRRGNLRWIEAGKVPSLVEFFNAKDAAEPGRPIIATVSYGSHAEPSTAPLDSGSETMCAVHTDVPAKYSCETCLNLFCKSCPSSYGSNVKICPFCGAMCVPVDAPAAAAKRSASVSASSHGDFGFGDLGQALAFPFRYKTSLIFGAVMYAVFQIAGGGSPFGGIFMLAATLTCMMMANTLTFGIMANTVENFAQGKLDENFMPSFDDFNIWDDVVHPFFLSIGVYLSSFGPLMVVALVGIFVVAGGTGSLGSDAVAKIDPQYASAPQTMTQGQALQEMVKKTAEAQKQRVDSIQDMEKAASESGVPKQPSIVDQDKENQDLNKTMQDAQRQQVESTLGKAPETKAAEQAAMIKKVIGFGAIFLLVGGLALLWGLLYFPAACAVAGYTRSFGATLNPTVGLDTIKQLGGSYMLILVMCLLLGLALVSVNGVFGVAFAAFDLPSVGNLPAKFLGSLIGFYVWIVFSCLLGFALFRKADRFQFVR